MVYSVTNTATFLTCSKLCQSSRTGTEALVFFVCEMTSRLELKDSTDQLWFALQAVLPPPGPFKSEQRTVHHWGPSLADSEGKRCMCWLKEFPPFPGKGLTQSLGECMETQSISKNKNYTYDIRKNHNK